VSIVRVVVRLIVPFVLAAAAFQTAHAELPLVSPVQVLEPNGSDAVDDPNELPYPPFFGAAIAVQGNVALAGMPGAFEERGRVAFFVRDAAGQWIRRQTLTVSNAAPGAGFGSEVALFNKRALVASRTAVYMFQLQSGKWLQTGTLPFGRTVQILDMDWHWNTVIVGAQDSTGNAAYAFNLAADGTFRRIARIAPADARPADRFGERVAVYSTTVAISAAGYNSGQGAAYVYMCSDTSCSQRQKLLANDGEPGDDFAHSIDLSSGVLIVGAPAVDFVPGDPNEAPSGQNFRAGGAAYVFVRSGSSWVEQQKLRPTPQQLNWYASFGYEVLASATHVVIAAPYQFDNWDPGYAVHYGWSGGSLVATHAMPGEVSHGEIMAIYNNTLFVATPAAPPYWGSTGVYTLNAP
jgi:hypothetical protein